MWAKVSVADVGGVAEEISKLTLSLWVLTKDPDILLSNR